MLFQQIFKAPGTIGDSLQNVPRTPTKKHHLTPTKTYIEEAKLSKTSESTTKLFGLIKPTLYHPLSAPTSGVSLFSATATHAQTSVKKAPWQVHKIPAPKPPTKAPGYEDMSKGNVFSLKLLVGGGFLSSSVDWLASGVSFIFPQQLKALGS